MKAPPELVDPRTLRPHEANGNIYRAGAIDDLVLSIREHGVLEPIVATSDSRIISGHRRCAAAIAVGLHEVPVRRESFINEVLALVHFNRQRNKSWTEIYREAELLLPQLKERAAERRREGGRQGGAARSGVSVSTNSVQRTRAMDELERFLGIGRERLRKLLHVHRSIAAGEIPQSIADELDSGHLTVHEAYRAAGRYRRLQRDHENLQRSIREGYADLSHMIQPFDVWTVHQRDRRFGGTGEGEELLNRRGAAIPAQATVNLVHHFTNEGDLVVDPMAGTGATIDVCRALGRRCRAFDLNPRRADVVRHDLLTEFPKIDEPPSLIVLDPPYGDQYRYSSDPNDLSRLHEEDFYDAIGRIMDCCLAALRPGGRLGIFMGSEVRRGEVHDRAWRVGRILEDRGVLRQRIAVPYPPSNFPDYQTSRAKTGRLMLSLIRELFIAQSVRDQEKDFSAKQF